jgi:PadR family transcriptional regulator, regulatory protein PadR
MGGRQNGELLPGTFETLLLKALSLGPIHGWGVAQRIEALSGGVFSIQQGAVYPALQRLTRRRLISSEWRESDNNRRARYYKLTAAGRRALNAETESWRRVFGGVERVLRATTQEG